MCIRQTAILSILLLCITLVHAYEINALQTGTVFFEDKLIRLNTCMSKKVQLKLTKEYYNKNTDISVIVSIAGLKMDDQLAFYIYHLLNCNKKFCELQINLQRYTPQVNKMFNYQVTIDYLVAQGLKTVDFNMTYYKQHFQIPTFEQNMKVKDWSTILIPYGFSDMKLLGNIKHEIIAQPPALKLTYIDLNNLDMNNNLQSWTLNAKFVLYKVLFLPKQYLRNSQNEESFLQFVGFKSTSSNQLVSQLYYINQNQLIQQSIPDQQEGSYFRISIKKTVLLFDNRSHQMLPSQLAKPSVAVQSGSNFQRMLFGVVFLVVLQIFYLIYKKKVNASRQDGLNQTVIFPDLIVSFEERAKNTANFSYIRTTENELTSN